mmetsp:Transcript_12693/g.30007  ORF Transcript_12693/g.30007 Transcript_12693/m.30007 type:complete len:222 (-) Transcript_12693:412-1077(-)
MSILEGRSKERSTTANLRIPLASPETVRGCPSKSSWMMVKWTERDHCCDPIRRFVFARALDEIAADSSTVMKHPSRPRCCVSKSHSIVARTLAVIPTISIRCWNLMHWHCSLRIDRGCHAAVSSKILPTPCLHRRMFRVDRGRHDAVSSKTLPNPYLHRRTFRVMLRAEDRCAVATTMRCISFLSRILRSQPKMFCRCRSDLLPRLSNASYLCLSIDTPTP